MTVEWKEIHTAGCKIGTLEIYVSNDQMSNGKYNWTIWQGRTRIAVGTENSFKDAQTVTLLRAKEFEP